MTNFNIELLPISVTYVGETVRENKWGCDQWRVTIGGARSFWNTDYFTGLGLRTKPKQSWALSKPKKPSNVDVLHALFTDADAADYNFSDWCDTYGYSDDSIGALNTYRQCLETATMLRKHFTQEQREAIKTIIQDM